MLFVQANRWKTDGCCGTTNSRHSPTKHDKLIKRKSCLNAADC